MSIALKRDMEGRYMTEVGSGGDVTITAVEATQDKAEFINFYNSLSGFNWQHESDTEGFLDSGTTLQDVPLDTVIHRHIQTTPKPTSSSGAAPCRARGEERGQERTYHLTMPSLC